MKQSVRTHLHPTEQLHNMHYQMVTEVTCHFETRKIHADPRNGGLRLNLDERQALLEHFRPDTRIDIGTNPA